MGYNCKKCGFYKMTDKQRCCCNVKKFDESKLSKKTRKEKAPTQIKQVSEKKKERLKTNGTEGDMFKKIFKVLAKFDKNYCAICKAKVDEDEVQPACFPHILPKGTYGEYRYFTNNIGFVCGIEHHDKFDEAINNFKQDKGLLELEKIIKDGKVPKIEKYINY